MANIVNPDGSVTRTKETASTTPSLTTGSIVKGVFIGMWLFYISAAIVSAIIYHVLTH